MASMWALSWASNVRWSRLSRWTACKAQHAPVAWPPFTFGCPLAARCWAWMYMLPFQSHVGTQWRVQRAMKKICYPGEPSWGQHAAVVRPLFTFGCILQPGFEFSPRARAGPSAAAVEDEGVSPPGVLVMLSTLSYSSQILATWPIAASLRPHPD